ncbi:MAG: bacteriohemerythrin [Treponema sp.]|jgi:hemerythrin|nr:bacteriohemerythrin [Treponema sp.]
MYEWNPVLETGHEKIDEQHKQLISALNDINDAWHNGKGSDEIFKTLEFLTKYTIMHFSTEEHLQVKYEYPEYNSHKQLHEDFKKAVKGLTQKLIDKGPCEDLIKEVTTTVIEWLYNHIKSKDFHMAAYIKSKGDTGK